MFDKLLKMMEIFTRSHFPSFLLGCWFDVTSYFVTHLLPTKYNRLDMYGMVPFGGKPHWGRTVFPFSFLNKFQKPTENRFLTETWQKSLQLWERNLKCVLRKSCSPRLATLLTRDWGIIQRWRVWWSKSFERKKGVQAWNSVKYFHPCYAEISIAQHGKSMLNSRLSIAAFPRDHQVIRTHIKHVTKIVQYIRSESFSAWLTTLLICIHWQLHGKRFAMMHVHHQSLFLSTPWDFKAIPNTT